MVTVAVFATHGLGAECLKLLHNHPEINISIVVTYAPDTETWWTESVYETATELNLSVVSLSEQDTVLDHEIDYLISVYYPEILGEELLSHPTQGAVNLHQAELPRYRGSNVFAHAIMNARAHDHWQYGTTLHEMVEEVDAGSIIDRAFVDIYEDDTARTLYDRTRDASISLFEQWLPAVAGKSILEQTTPQDEFDGERYFYTKESLDDLFCIDADRLAVEDQTGSLAVYDQIRALEFPPLDPAYTEIAGKKVHITTQSTEGE